MDKLKPEVAYLCERWQCSGIEAGDTLLLHSNVKRTLVEGRHAGFREMAVADVLDSLLVTLGSHGTLILPLFNFDFTTGVPFDVRSSPSKMGALTEVGRARSDAVRTGHPIYSFCAIGRQADKFAGVNNKSGYGADSPFGLLRDLDGKIGVLDLDDQDSMTFYHHVEEMHEVDYRFHKNFTGQYTDATGVSEQRTYSLFVRNIERGVLTHVNPAGELLWGEGLYKGCRPKQGCGLRTISASKMFDFVSDIIREGRAENVLYKIEGAQ